MSRVAVLLLALACCGVASARLTAKQQTTYVLAIFGDSVTDTGNVFRLGGVPDPDIYWRGRFSDGPNWVDYLNATLSKKNKVKVFNYARAGATACTAYMNMTRYPLGLDCANQTATFIADFQSGKIPTGPNVKLLPIQWLGSNDITVYLSQTISAGLPTQAQIAALIRNIITCRLTSAVAIAAATGAKDILVLPQLPLHRAPLVPAFLRDLVRQVVDAIDVQISLAVAAVQAQLDAAPPGSPVAGATVHLLGDSKWLDRMLADVRPAYKYIDEPCFFHPGSSVVLYPGIKVCNNSNEHAFYDEIHAGTRYHKWLVDRAMLPRMQMLRLLPAQV